MAGVSQPMNLGDRLREALQDAQRTLDEFHLSATIGGSAINAGATLGFQVAPDRSQAFAVEGTLGFPATSGIAYETAS